MLHGDCGGRHAGIGDDALVIVGIFSGLTPSTPSRWIDTSTVRLLLLDRWIAEEE